MELGPITNENIFLTINYRLVCDIVMVLFCILILLLFNFSKMLQTISLPMAHETLLQTVERIKIIKITMIKIKMKKIM